MKADLTRTIHSEDQLDGMLTWLLDLVKRGLPGGSVLIGIGRPRRKEDQSALFHALCGDVARQKEYMGKKLTKDQWKVLFVSAHAIATGLGAEVICGLEGEFVNIRESTASMSKSRMSSLIEYAIAWCVENEVELSTYERMAA